MFDEAALIKSIDEEIARIEPLVAQLDRLRAARTALNGIQPDKTTREKRQRADRADESVVVKARKQARGKLTQEKADQIREMAGSAATIAKQFGISRTMVSHIRAGRRWAPVQEVVAEPETPPDDRRAMQRAEDPDRRSPQGDARREPRPGRPARRGRREG